MAGDEHPKAMYKDGGEELIWGNLVQTRVVQSEDEELEALEDGWRLHPVDSDGPKVGAAPKRRARSVKGE